MEEDPPGGMEPEEGGTESQSDLEVTVAEGVNATAVNPRLLKITLFDTTAVLPWGAWN